MGVWKGLDELRLLDGMDDAWLTMEMSLRWKEWKKGEEMYSSCMHLYEEEGIKVLTYGARPCKE